MNRIRIFKYLFLSLFAAIFCHNLDVQLENDVPSIIDDTCINKTIYYPDTIVCTLNVIDLNDTLLEVAAVLSDTVSGTMIIRDTTEWPGNYFQISNVFDTKQIIVTLPGNDMCLLSGSLLISDEEGAGVAIPYILGKAFQDTFSSSSPDTNLWYTYCADDTAHIITAYLPLHKNYVLKFFLDTGTVDECKSTGMRSKFGLVGDFRVTIDFGLIELSYERLNGVNVSFFISTSPDTTQWSGIEAGLYLHGVNNRLRVRAAKGFDGKSQDITYFAGKMKIERNESMISLFCWDGNLQIDPEPLKSVKFSATDTIFIHLQMRVDSLDYSRYCIWDNLLVNRGEVLCD